MLERRRIKFIHKKARGLSVLFTYLIAFLVVLIIFTVILPTLSQSLLELASNLPSYYRNITEYIENQPEDSFLKQIGAEEIIKNLEQIDIKEVFSIENTINYIKNAIGVVNGVFTAFLALMVSIYTLLERKEILKGIRKLLNAIFNEKTCENIETYFSKTNDIFYRYLSSQVIDAIVIGMVLSIVMLIMGVKYALLLGFMIGIFNLIPYFGAIIGVGITLIITLLTGGLTQTIWTGIVIIILQQIDANIINPKIVGNSLTVSPLLVIFSVTVGGAYFGFIGMLLAVPAMVTLKTFLGDYLDYKASKKVTLTK